MKLVNYFLLLTFSYNIYASVENTITIESNTHQDSNSSLSFNYNINNIFELSEETFLYLDNDFFISDNNKLFNPQELRVQYEKDNYDLSIGFNTIFFGVAETYNPVDIINRKNFFTINDNKDKLGEFIVGGNYFINDTTLGVYILPKFYQQKFLAKNNYQGIDISSHIVEEDKISYALRYKQIIDNIDLGVTYFDGASREHILVPNINKFDVFYPDLQQLGIDAQLTTESALYKLEYINKKHHNNYNYNLVAGIEYMFITGIEINGLIEYLKSNSRHIFQNDIMLGIRFNLSNSMSTEGIASFIYDRDYHSKILTLTGSTRINNNLKFDANISFFDANDNDLLLRPMENSIGLSLNYYF